MTTFAGSENIGMENTEEKFKKIISHSKEYGFIFPGSEIYDGLAAVYDYGQNGVLLKNKIRDYWWKSMVRMHDNIVGIDTAIFMHPTVWKASGHLEAFSDPLIDNKESKKRYRADVLIEEHLAKMEGKIEKEVEKARKKFQPFDEQLFRTTNGRVKDYQTQAEQILTRFKAALEQSNLSELRQIIIDCEIVCPVSGSRNWTEVRQFNLMFSTGMGSVSDDAQTIYLRPETAQGIFVNFLNVQKSGRMKIPFGIAQTGKAFRNEIVARQFIFRMREFEQMEMQFFIAPGTQQEWYEYWKTQRMSWHNSLGFPSEYYRFHDHAKLAHYADAACDIEFNFPFGFKELEGIHSRTDFDLRNHEKFSGKKQQYFDPEKNASYIPYVVETSVGLDRLFLALLSASYNEETLPDASERVVLKLPPQLAPYHAAILPLVKKDGIPEVAEKIAETLKASFDLEYDEKDAIGRRYRRQDAIGTPFCITVDHQTLEDQTATLRNRDTMQQDRIPVSNIKKYLEDKLDIETLLCKSA